MPSNLYSDEELKGLLLKRVARLMSFIKLKTHPVIISRELGMIVASTKLLFGIEVVDRQMDQIQGVYDAREAGICEECRKEPAGPGSTLCGSCRQEIEKEYIDQEFASFYADGEPPRVQ